MKVLINYANPKFASAQRWNTWTAKHIAKFDAVYNFNPEDIEPSFIEEHKEIFAEKRGNGLWLWKPYFIDVVLQSLKDGDIIFYCDSGAMFIRYPQAVFDSLCDELPLFVCDIPLIESCWTKPLCFQEMDCNTNEIKYSNQIVGTYFAIYINDFSRRFISEWLSLCCRYELLSPEGLPKKMVLNRKYNTEFISHREDQSIFSLLCKKYGILPHKDISHRPSSDYKSEYYAYKEPLHPHDNYKPILFLHKQPSLRMYFLKRIYTVLRLYKVKQRLLTIK